MTKTFWCVFFSVHSVLTYLLTYMQNVCWCAHDDGWFFGGGFPPTQTGFLFIRNSRMVCFLFYFSATLNETNDAVSVLDRRTSGRDESVSVGDRFIVSKRHNGVQPVAML